MLGYNIDELDQMIKSVGLARKSVPRTQVEIHEGLDKAQDFLQGLWAEGYFD